MKLGFVRLGYVRLGYVRLGYARLGYARLRQMGRPIATDPLPGVQVPGRPGPAPAAGAAA